MKKVAVIQDLSAFGKCSLTAAIPVLSVMGVQACPLPTAVLSAQTAYDNYFCQDLTDEMPAFTTHWQQLGETFDGIQTGFVTGEAQVAHIRQFLEVFQQPETTVLIDPVLGDDGEQYKMFSPKLLDQMKALVQHATIVTPNITECCLLTGIDYHHILKYREEESFLAAVTEAAQALQAQTNAKVIVTGVQANPYEIGNVVIDGAQGVYMKQPFDGKSYSGTGDLFAAVVMGGMMRGDMLKDSIERAQQFLSAAIAQTTTDPKAGIYFEANLRMLMD